MNKVTVALKRVGQPMTLVEVDADSLKAVQELVGGCVQFASLGLIAPGLVAGVNEDGIPMQLPENGQFLGDWFACRMFKGWVTSIKKSDKKALGL